MIIRYERTGNCLWHEDCAVSHLGGIMKVVSHSDEASLMECLHCGMKGEYPVGGIGSVSVEAML